MASARDIQGGSAITNGNDNMSDSDICNMETEEVRHKKRTTEDVSFTSLSSDEKAFIREIHIARSAKKTKLIGGEEVETDGGSRSPICFYLLEKKGVQETKHGHVDDKAAAGTDNGNTERQEAPRSSSTYFPSKKRHVLPPPRGSS